MAAPLKYFLDGTGGEWMRGTLTYASNDPENNPAVLRDKVQNAVEGIPIIGKKLSAQIADNGNDVKVHAPLGVWPGYRFNLTVNYAF